MHHAAAVRHPPAHYRRLPVPPPRPVPAWRPGGAGSSPPRPALHRAGPPRPAPRAAPRHRLARRRLPVPPPRRVPAWRPCRAGSSAPRHAPTRRALPRASPPRPVTRAAPRHRLARRRLPFPPPRHVPKTMVPYPSTMCALSAVVVGCSAGRSVYFAVALFVGSCVLGPTGLSGSAGLDSPLSAKVRTSRGIHQVDKNV